MRSPPTRERTPAYAAPASEAARSRRRYGNSAKIASRNALSAALRGTLRSICGRVASSSWSYCTPDGHAVTHAMQPRQRSMCVVNAPSRPISPLRAISMR